MKRLKKWKLTCLLIFVLFLTGCRGEFVYQGDYPELYSVALASILGQLGLEMGGFAQPPLIVIIEKDQQGRVMFRYNEGNSLSRNNLVIMQNVDGDYAYFYPHYNFISIDRGNFSTDDIEALRVANSWNQPMSDSNEFVRVRISRQRDRGPVPEDDLIEVYHAVFPNAQLTRHSAAATLMTFLRNDDYGRSIYLGEGVGEELLGVYIVFVFQPDHSFDLETGILLIEDPNNYQTELRLWMEANGWNQPWEE